MIIHLTTLDKSGKFKEFEHLISVDNGKRGLHLVVLYLVVGRWRIPWSFRVWRGKGTTSPAQLGLKLVQRLPKSLKSSFQVMILADTALECFFPQILVSLILLDIERLIPLVRSHGFDIHIFRCKI